MNKLMHALRWDLYLLLKYNIVTVAAFVTSLYLLVFYFLPSESIEPLLVLLILSDPTMLGFMFIGALVLFEKDANTLQALVVTPLLPAHYIVAKAAALTLLALVCSLVMAIAGYGWHFNVVCLMVGVIYGSLLFVLIGIAGVARCRTFNQYIIIMPFTLIPLTLPFYNLFVEKELLWLYVFPTQGVIILTKAAFGNVAGWKLLYGSIYPLPALVLAYRFAHSSFVTHVIRGGR